MNLRRSPILVTLLFVCLTACMAIMAAPEGMAHDTRPQEEEDQDLLTSLVSMNELSPALLALTIVIAIALGAIHALSPGHGKALVAAYLVGTRSRAKDALLLGGIVTVTHTAGVFILGLVALAASNWLLPERLLPWLSVVSGLIVLGVGAFMLIGRLKQRLHQASDHDHAHSHGDHHHHIHPHGAAESQGRLDRKTLLALGVSGGALPCPSALMLLLTAIALNRVAFGLVLLLAFSFGLGAALTLTGWLFLKARKLIDRFSSASILNWLPVVSAGVIMALGLAISIKALQAVLK